MKALLISDLHTSYRVLSSIHQYLEKNQIKVVVFAGDTVDMGEPVGFMEELIWLIDNLELELMWVPGNNDFGRAYHKLNAKYKSLEGRIIESNGLRFTGVGGSPASWAGQYQGERSVDKKAIAGTVFVSHVPPPGLANFQKFDQANHKIQDIPKGPLNPGARNKQIQNNNNQNNNVIPSPFNSIKGEESQNHVSGNTAKLKLSDAPLVHICGHIHHTWGIGYLGSTKVVKLAASYLGYYAIMDLETLHVDFGRMWK